MGAFDDCKRKLAANTYCSVHCGDWLNFGWLTTISTYCVMYFGCVFCVWPYIHLTIEPHERHIHTALQEVTTTFRSFSVSFHIFRSLSLCRSASLKMWNLHLYLTFVWISREGKPAFHTDSVFSKFTDVTPNEMRIEFSKRIACFFPIFFFNFRSLSASFVRCLRRCRRSFCSFPFHPHSLPSN